MHGKAVRACLLVMMARENISAGGETCVVEATAVVAVGGDCAGSDIEARERGYCERPGRHCDGEAKSAGE